MAQVISPTESDGRPSGTCAHDIARKQVPVDRKDPGGATWQIRPRQMRMAREGAGECWGALPGAACQLTSRGGRVFMRPWRAIPTTPCGRHDAVPGSRSIETARLGDWVVTPKGPVRFDRRGGDRHIKTEMTHVVGDIHEPEVGNVAADTSCREMI